MSVLRDSMASDQLREGSLLFNDDSASRPSTRYDTVEVHIRYETVEAHIRYDTVDTQFY